MRTIRTVPVVVLALALSACATTWVKPGATEQDLVADKSNCEQGAENEYLDSSGSRLARWGSSLDRNAYVERCLIAHGWRDRAQQTASVQAPPPAETDAPLQFPVYSR